jgi:hypothetical protein
MGHRWGLPVFLHPGEVKFVPDSALEGAEFELSVPRDRFVSNLIVA